MTPASARRASARQSGTGKVAVFGAGSWGTAFSVVLADAGNDVTMWARREEVAAAINDTHENPGYHAGVTLPPTISATHDIEKAAYGADLVVLAAPSQTLRANLAGWAPYIPEKAPIISLMKGVELGTLERMSEVIANVADAAPERIAVVSGPNLSPEIIRREPAAGVVACASEDVAQAIQARIHSPAFRPYTSTDVVGCELGGAYKNVVAIAVGFGVGLGFGDNAAASLITRGLAETARLGMKLGANPITLMGLAGLGDLVATCNSPLSRNRTFGEKLGRGMTVEEIVASSHQVAEGAKSCRSLRELAGRYGVDVPLAQYVDDVVSGVKTVPEVMDEMLERPTKAETD
ncbi:MAG: NAD(P)-dependent glycerol-3-phosphate dehydrogenase [Nocardioides sp.]|nr:NAD(P)-dependent glycerol-3-phosphate dehydrogenase [Nocardioides sp.]